MICRAGKTGHTIAPGDAVEHIAELAEAKAAELTPR
jgi:hypothetical protein